mmetsp:Transcript_15588/g.37466  ORF Transcript_15588/g.37466 Transcript_15588/m.37466 type:complete len:652 (+) Transcript_15588:191-2146(+)
MMVKTMLAMVPAVLCNQVAVMSGRLEHLLKDVRISIEKDAQDAEVVGASYRTLFQKLSQGLHSELKELEHQAEALRQQEQAEHNKTAAIHAEMKQLTGSAQGSKQLAKNYEGNADNVKQKFQMVEMSLKALVSMLQNAVITPDGTLLTQAGSSKETASSQTEIVQAVRRVLWVHRSLLQKDDSVLKAFKVQEVQNANSFAAPLKIKMSGQLLASTIGTLTEIQEHISQKKAVALAEFSSRVQRYQSAAVATESDVVQRDGQVADSDWRVQELKFAQHFTDTVIAKDREFLQRLDAYVNRTDMLEGQQKKLQEFALGTIAKLDQELGQHAQAPASFVQMKGIKKTGKHHSLTSEIEDALKTKKDTHTILMRIKGMLDSDAAASLTTDNVKNVMGALQQVLKKLTKQQDSASLAQRQCESQNLNSAEEQRSEDRELNLMRGAMANTVAAMSVAKAHLTGIHDKQEALTQVEGQFVHLDSSAGKTIGDQVKNRNMILMALQKALIVAEKLNIGQSASQFKDLEVAVANLDRSVKEQRHEAVQLLQDFQDYTKTYQELLTDRQEHYTHALSDLQLHMAEIQEDVQAHTVSTEHDHDAEGERSKYCSLVLMFFQSEAKRRADAIQTIRAVLPQVPEILTLTEDSQQPAAFLQVRSS